MLHHTVEFINDNPSLLAVLARLNAAAALALDIETVNWWDRDAERVSLIQLAFRENSTPHVIVIDALAGLDLEPLRQSLELSARTKAIHNASFDAVKLARHFRIATSPIHDTMLAARRSGDKKCSLKAQVEIHLGLELDKAEQRGDWGRRPLSNEQLNYAALDATCTLLLYEQQMARGLRGDYELRGPVETLQESLPLAGVELPIPTSSPHIEPATVTSAELTQPALALLGIVAELSGRYSPEQLAVSVGNERIGLAGWIVDRLLGFDADLDESIAQQEIVSLRENGLILLSPSRRLEATATGQELWRQNKPS
ncbi:MAG: hypothetical protein ACREEM_52705 [Blastocatellia bacterium]